MATGFTRVQPSADELGAFHRRYGFTAQPRVYRVQCDVCGLRFWGSGLAIGSHLRGARHLTAVDMARLITPTGAAS